MSSKRQVLFIFITSLFALFAFPTLVHAIPPLPSSLYGTVKLNGENVPAGTLIEALIGDIVVSQGYTDMYEGNSIYAINVNGDDTATSAKDGGIEGDTITFRVGGLIAEQNGTWHGGTNVELNLTIVSESQLGQPQKTPTPVFTQTAIAKQSIPVTGEENQSTGNQVSTSNMIIGAGIITLLIIVTGIIVFRKKK